MLNLNDHIERMKFIDLLYKQVDEFCVSEFEDDPRKHLGASIIGHDCQAYAWNIFRWLKYEEFSGRMLRLFDRGHEEEKRFIRWLKGAGFEVFELDEDTKSQFRISGSKGHFGGSLDGVAVRMDVGAVLAEFKTHNTKSFKDLKAKGVVRSKPKHYKQMCSYGRAYSLKFSLYCAVNKDTDELHFELLPLDFKQADDLFRKADAIIWRQTQPQKIAQVATYFECKQCVFAGVCHNSEMPDKNCRSCVKARPIEDGQWYCDLWNTVIPAEAIEKGCDSWQRII